MSQSKSMTRTCDGVLFITLGRDSIHQTLPLTDYILQKCLCKQIFLFKISMLYKKHTTHALCCVLWQSMMNILIFYAFSSCVLEFLWRWQAFFSSLAWKKVQSNRMLVFTKRKSSLTMTKKLWHEAVLVDGIRFCQSLQCFLPPC